MAIQLNQNALDRRKQASVDLAQKRVEKQFNKSISNDTSIGLDQNIDKSDANFFEKSGQTVLDVIGNVGVGLGKAIEGVVDAGATIVGEVGGVFDKGFKKQTSDFIKRDFTGEWVQNPLDSVTQDSILNNNKIGQTIEGVAQGVGQLLPNIILTATGAGALSMPMLFTRSAGNAVEEGLQNDANLDKSLLFGVASGTIETLTEGISDKLFGSTTIDKALGKKVVQSGLFKSAKSGFGKLMQDAVGEGIEEMVSEIASPFLKQIYTANSFGEGLQNGLQDSLTMQQVQSVIDAGIVGALTSIAFKPVDKVARIVSPTYDNLTKLSKVQSQIIEYNDTASKLNQAVSEGKITLNDENYNKIINELNTLKTQIENNVSQIQFRGSENSKTKAQNQLANVLNTNASLGGSIENGQVKVTNTNQLNAVNNNYNQEAYSINLQGQEDKLTFKPTKNAVSEDVKKSISLANKFSRNSKLYFNTVVTDDFDANKNGAFEYKNNVLYISSKASPEQLKSILVTHEFTHALEGTEAYRKYANYILSKLQKNPSLIEKLGVDTNKYGRTLADYINYIVNNYAKNNVDLDLQGAVSEVIAKYTSEYLFKDEATINRLCEEDLSLGKKILRWIQDKINIFKGNSKEERQMRAFLKRAENLYKNAIANARAKGVKENLDKDKEEQYSVSDNNYKTLEGVDTEYIPARLQDALVKYHTDANNTKIELLKEKLDSYMRQLPYAPNDTIRNALVEKIKSGRVEYDRLKTIRERTFDFVQEQEWGNDGTTRNFISSILEGRGFGEATDFYDNTEAINLFTTLVSRYKLYTNTKVGSSTVKIIDKDVLPKNLKDIISENKLFNIKTNFYLSGDKDFSDALGMFYWSKLDASNNGIYIKVDEFSKSGVVNTNRHEKLHYFKHENPGLFSTFSKDIGKLFTQQEKDSLWDTYYKRYKKSYKLVENDKKNPVVWEEIYCQMYALNEKIANKQKVYDAIDSFENKVKKAYSLKENYEIKYSIPDTDSQGNTLTEKQREFFNDSKVVDENGKLKVVYHGTTNPGFTIFDDTKRKAYFTTDNLEVAKGYQQHRDYKNIYKGYLNLKNPLIVDGQEKRWINLPKQNIKNSLNLSKEQLDKVYEEVFGEPRMLGSSPQDITLMALASNKFGYTNFDGVIVNNVYDDLQSDKRNLGNDYIFFKANQFKNLDNTNPTSDPDIRFSITDEDIENNNIDNKIDKMLDMFTLNDWLEMDAELNRQEFNEIKTLPTKNERREAFVKKLYNEGKLNDIVTKIVNNNPQMKEYFKNTQMNEKYDPLSFSKKDKYIVMFHGTPNRDFYSFDSNRIGTNGTQMGSGFYFTEALEYANGYKGQNDSGKVISALLKIEKPLSRSKHEITKTELKKFISMVVDKTGDDFLSNYGDVYSEGYNVVLNNAVDSLFEYESNDADMIEEIYVSSRMDFDKFHNGLTKLLGYDGIIAWGKMEGTQAIVFNSNQIKDIFNYKPTEDSDIRYSVSDDIDGNKLVALHNLSEDKLRNAIKLGGLPVPSIAITKASQGHSKFGDISLVFKKDTIDPENWRNKVYSADAYSKRFPKTVNKLSSNAVKELRNKFEASAKLFGENTSGFETYLEDDTISNIAYKLARKDYVKLQYLKDNNIEFEPVYTEFKLKDEDDFIVKKLIQKYGKTIADFRNVDSDYVISDIMPFLVDVTAEYWNNYAEELLKNSNDPMKEKKANGFRNLGKEVKMPFWKADNYLKEVYEYQQKQGTKVLAERATEEKLSQATKDKFDDIEKYVRDLLSQYDEGLYFRNDKDVFTYSGNRRSFEQLYDKVTLSSMVNYMTGQVQNSEGWNYGVGNVRSLLTKQFKTIQEMRDNSDLIVDSEKMETLKEQSQELFFEVCEEIMPDDLEIGGEILADIAKGSLTTERIKRILGEYRDSNKSAETVEHIKEFLTNLKNYPTEYFEAKPQRAVYFDEVAKVIAPKNLGEDIKKYFQDNNIDVVLYDENEENNRIEIIKNLPDDIRFSIPDIDSDGNKLSKKQQEFFKDSKVVDNNGRLKPMYHTSSNPDFTVFDASKSDDKISLFFTDSLYVANTYSLGTGKIVDVNNLNKVDINKMSLEEFNKYIKGFKTTLIDVVEKIDDEYIQRKENEVKARLKDELFPSAYNNPDVLDKFVKARLQDIYENKGKYIANGLYGASFGSLNAMKEKAFENLKMTEAYKKTVDDTYKVYLNVTNPLIIDGEKSVRKVYDTIYLTYDYGDFYFHAVTDDDYNGIQFSHRLESIEDKNNLEEIIKFLTSLDNNEVKSAVLEFLKTDNTYDYYKSHIKYQGKNKALTTTIYQKWNNIENNGSSHNTRGWARIAYNEGYDGVIFNNIVDNGGRKYGTETPSQVVVVFDSNQIKDITNTEPTTSNDIRFSILDDAIDEVNAREQEDNKPVTKDTSNIKGQTRSTDNIKYRAKLNQDKVYSKEELNDLISETVKGIPDMRISAKTRDIAVESLFERMNTQDQNERAETAETIADFIINNAYYENIDGEFPSQAQTFVEMIKGEKFNISYAVKQELQYVFDKKSGQAIFNKYYDKQGIIPEDLAEELNQYGANIDLTNSEQQVFMDIYNLYKDSQKIIKDYYSERNQLAKDVLNKDEIKNDKQQLVSEILKAYETKGSETPIAKLKTLYRATIAKLKNDLRDTKLYANAFVDFMNVNKQAKEVIKKGYSASQLDNDVVKGFLKEVAGAGNIKSVAKNARDRMRALKEIYTLSGDKSLFKALQESQQEEYDIFGQQNNYYDMNLADMIAEIADGEGELNATELNLLTKITQGFLHLYQTFDKTFKDGKYQETTSLAEKYTQSLSKHIEERKKVKTVGFLWKGKELYDAHSVFRNMDSYDVKYNKELGINEDVGFFSEFYKDITDGEVKAKVAEIELLEPFGKFYKEHKGFEKRLTNDNIQLELDKPITTSATSMKFEKANVDIPLGEAISIYLTSLRPQANFENTTITLKNKNGTQEQYKMSVQQVEEMYKGFDENTKAYIKLVQKFFNEDATKLKVETDMQMWGYTNIEEGGNYFPINRESSTLAKKLGDASIATDAFNVYNASFNKSTRPGARQSLFIGNVYSIVEKHAWGVSAYYGLYAPLKAFNQVYNKRIGVDNYKTSLRQITKSNLVGATEYIDKLLKDIQGISSKTGFNKVFQNLRGNYAKYQLGLNPKTVLGQTSSYLMAQTYLDLGSLAKGLTMKANTEQMYKYAPFTKYRMVEKDVVKAQTNIIDKINNGVIGQIGETLTTPIAWMDNNTVKKLWNACQVQVEKNAGYKIGSEENLTASGKLLEKVVRETQSNSIVSEKTGLARTQNELLSALTMFTSDAQKQLSRLVDGVGTNAVIKAKIKSGELSKNSMEAKVGKKLLARSASGFITATTLYVLIGMMMRWLLGKRDEDKTLGEEFLGDFSSQVVGMLPIVKDVYGYLIKGYDMNNYAYSMVTDLIDGVKGMTELTTKLISGKQLSNAEIYSPIRKALYGTSQILGLPTRNLYNYTYGIISKFSPSTAYRINSLFYEPKMTELDKAIENNQTRLSESIIKELYKSRNIDIDSIYAKELINLYKEGYSIIPSKISDKFTYNEIEFNLTPAQQKKLIQVANSAVATNKTIIGSKLYATMSSKAKSAYLKANYNINYIKAIAEIVGVENLKDGDYKKYLFVKSFNSNSKLIDYMAYISSIESDVDKNGKVIANSRKNKIQKYINSLKLSSAEKYLLMSYAGYKNKYGEAQVKNYLNRQQLSKDEVKKILEYCGY